MKSMHCVYRNGCFDDQYTLELEGFMSRTEFASTMNTFNAAAIHHPPPPSISSSRLVLFNMCTTISILCSIGLAIHYTHHVYLLLVIPISFLTFSLVIISWRRRLKQQFEASILHLCACMNATENVRGINFRLVKYTAPEQHLPPLPPSDYSIVIEFDDRYNLLHHFSAPHPVNDTLSTTNDVILNPPTYRTSLLNPPTYRQSQAELPFPSNAYHPDEKV
ncbi:hypothetical protein BX666DRAFT_1957863 [Dichotomocladium elegans]|nr:hypothetical protein BX666DRAFT_1957863 [Dichotomocladium elegans]